MEIIEKAIEKIQPINYEPFDTGYFVLKNGEDMGGQDHCINCIKEAVKIARTDHRAERNRIIKNYDKIRAKGFYYQGNKKVKMTEREILKAKRYHLKEYPAKVSFTYEGNDPDFGGGLQEPCSCENCGEYFQCTFEPSKDEAEHLLHIVNHEKPLTDRDKWEIDIALGNYGYVEDEVKVLLVQVAEKILK